MMTLTEFVTNLFQKGDIVVSSEIAPFAESDIFQAINVLSEQYKTDALDMPGTVPEFEPQAAAWGALFVYRAVQLAMLRSLPAEAIPELLPKYEGEITAEVTYSVDLSLRYLHDMFKLFSGLAPGDPLVQRLQEAAFEWPFSSIGVEIDASAQLQAILQHAALRQAYCDRIIAAKAQRRITHPALQETIEAALGDYQNEYWPGYAPLQEA